VSIIKEGNKLFFMEMFSLLINLLNSQNHFHNKTAILALFLI
jgi:hypothetical protein